MRPSAKKAAWLQKLQDEGITSGSRTLEDRPVLFLSVQWAWEAFDTLNSQRQVGQTGPQPVTLEAIAAYCSLTGITPNKCFFLVRAIPRMDGIFLSDFHNRNKPVKGKK